MSHLSPEMELWNQTCRWLGLDKDEVITPDLSLDRRDHLDEEHKGNDEKETEEEVDESPVVEDMSPGEQKRYWAGEQKWLCEAMRRLDVEEQQPKEKRDPRSGVSVLVGGLTCVYDGRGYLHEKSRKVKW